MPMEATIHKPAAVVKPMTFSFVLIIVPAPMKPIPITMAAETRAGSASRKAFRDRIVRRVEPNPTRIWVLKPAGFKLTSLSKPTTPLSKKPKISLATNSN